MKDKKKISFKKWYQAPLIASLAISFLITIYGPLEAYFLNKTDFWFDFYTIIGINIGMLVILSLVCFLILFIASLIHENFYRFCFSGYVVSFFLLYIEGTFLSRDIPMLDGRKINWNAFSVHRIITIAVCIVLIAIVSVLIAKLSFKKTEVIMKYILLGMTLMLFATVTYLGISNHGFERKKNMIVNREDEFVMSSNKNVVYIIVDAVNGENFNNVLADHPEYYSDFSDFTYYSDMLSCYTQTIFCIPNMLTGEWINEDERLDVFFSHVFNTSPFLDRLESEGYRIGIYDTYLSVAYDTERILQYDNIIRGNIRQPDILNFAKNLTKLVGYRYAPYDLKRFCQITDRDFKSAKNSEEKENLFKEENECFYDDLLNNDITLIDEPCFRFYHIQGGHTPYTHDEDMNYIGDSTYEQEIAASMTVTNALIDKMKAAGVYDNSIIIIAADHGFSLEDIPEARLNPIFIVKGIGEKSDKMRISDAPVSHEDLMVAYDRLLDGEMSDSIFDYKSGDQRDRRCFIYIYPEVLENKEYIQHGKSGDLTTLEKIDED